jgi:excisionase family DNA binding protein
MSTDKAQYTMVMTVTEVATFLRLAESTVYKLAQEGELPGRKIGGKWRFSRKEIEALLLSDDDDKSLSVPAT